MKANLRSRALPAPVLIGGITALLAGCVPPPPSTPAPTSAPARSYPTPTPPAPPPVADWRDASVTPGGWSYASDATGSAARFAGRLSLTCNRTARTVTLSLTAAPRAGESTVTLSVTTLNGDASVTRNLTARRTATGIEAYLPAADTLLDAMAFSRGRFAIAAVGEPTLYVPSWTEISRVVEDCR